MTFSRQWISSRTCIRRECLSLKNLARSRYASLSGILRRRTEGSAGFPLRGRRQRFRRPMHRRNSVQRWNRICRKSSGSSCKSIRLAARSADLSGCETAQIFSSWDRWDNTGIREPPNYSPKPTDRFPLTPMLARIWRRGGD